MMNRISTKECYFRKWLPFVCLLCILFTGCKGKDASLELILAEDTVQETTEDLQEDNMQLSGAFQKEPALTETKVQSIYVHVCGAVNSPGVVELSKEARVADALAAAGGFCENAHTDYVNQAARLEDGQQLYFPTVEEVCLLKEQESSIAEGLVNINTADESRLCTLPGIGQAKAQDIIAYREAHGEFVRIEDIMKVSGIKQSAYDKICDKITVE